MKRWGILGALDREVAILREAMVVEQQENALGTTFYSGRLYGQPVVLVCCGIGKVNAAACATYLTCVKKCDILINAGIAGGVRQGLRMLDVVISKELCFHDQDAVMLKYFPKCQFFQADTRLIALCEKACAQPEVLNTQLVVGRIATGDKFVNDRVTREAIVAATHPDCVEMEGAAIAHVAMATETPFLVLRTMSDCADDETNTTYDDFFERAADQSARILMEMLRLVGEENEYV